MGNVVPTLDTSGWVKGVAQKAERVMSYYVTTQYSQSNTFKGQVRSLQSTIQRTMHDKSALMQAVQTDMIALLNAYYDSVSVSVDIKPYKGDENKMNIQMTATVVEGGLSYDYGRLISVSNGIIDKVMPFEAV